jgi:hypothetical protein
MREDLPPQQHPNKSNNGRKNGNNYSANNYSGNKGNTKNNRHKHNYDGREDLQVLLGSNPTLSYDQQLQYYHDLEGSSHSSFDRPFRNSSISSRNDEVVGTDSEDDEINSQGEYSDREFDIRSKSSSEQDQESSDSYHRNEVPTTPYEVYQGSHYCKLSDHDTTTIDVCSFSSLKLFLLSNSDITCECTDKTRYRVTNNITLSKIFSYQGYLHGLSDGILFMLPNEYCKSKLWKWKEVPWCQEYKGNIKHISATHDGNHLWIQTATQGILYDQEVKAEFIEISHQSRRVYGSTKDHYVIIDDLKHTARTYPENEIHDNVYQAALTYYNDLVVITSETKALYSNIAIVEWIPYFIPKI